ncbi:MAG TPA: hypothetical protein VHY48_01970 [Acidobacteriaceae bacterium]|nr:hypothetical protein [Acidobacteriaceae bacterium]
MPPEQPMPLNTVLLSQMMRDLSTQPGFTDALIKELGGRSQAGKKGPALLTPDLITELRKRILGKDWQGLDRFPGWTMREITATVHALSGVIGQKRGSSENSPGGAIPGAQVELAPFLDLGPYALDQQQTLSLDEPSTLPGFSTQGLIAPMGYGVIRGDGPNELAPEHAASQRLADALNRLAVNELDGAKPFTVTIGGRSASTPQALMETLIATGHQVSVIDARYFANFGHLHYKGDEVMMPFWINTRLAVPHSGWIFGLGARPLLVPVAHAEYEWRVRGPKVNADVSYYFGIDGKSEWRTMDTLDQSWVLKRAVHAYTGAQVVEVTRLAGLLTIAYAHQHQRHPHLPFGGYYDLGVCQDGISAIEWRMTGKVTLFPNTADTALFNDPRDAEVNAMMRAIPKDRSGAPPQPERIFGSLPTEPGAAGSFDTITIPGVSADLSASYAAWQRGDLHHTHGRAFDAVAAAVAFAGASALIAAVRRQRAR